MADVNFFSIADQDGVTVQDKHFPDDGINPLDYSDIFKLSHATNIVVERCFIKGGKEDCIDMNRYCQNVHVKQCALDSSGLYCMTIKGGSKNIYLESVQIITHGKSYDIDIGNWSDQSAELTTQIVLDNVYSLDEKPVRVRVLWGDRPIVIGGNVKVIVYPRWIVKIYRWLRKRNLVP